MPTAQCNDIDIYYEIHGSGFPVVFISGLGAGTWAWEPQVPFFSRSYRMLSFDNRGAGRSGTPPGPYSIEQMALDTVRLLHALDIEETFVVGLSMGGMIAQELALILPHRVRGLILAATHPGGDLHVSGSPEVYQRLMDNTGLSPEEIVEKNISVLFSPNTVTQRPEIIQGYRERQKTIPEQPEHAFAAQQKAIQGFDCSGRLTRIKAPTLLLAGEDDQLIPPENARRMAEHIPDCQVRVFPQAGHLIHMERTKEFNTTVDEFCKARV
ncbi:alpha/beta fold hydrolase [Desulfovermiculus halophilus]|uniref:alpha/beta fold hydrolase n=1 Tax=Desulfovermiculus halophilus TaxID=339722 RepID=UPI00054D8014|nr:alpha/beta fold hydrolase [Desulfovermiculus halophilus]